MTKEYITSKGQIPTTGVTLVKFGAAWCQPCKQFDTVLDKLATLKPDVTILYVDVDAEPSVEFYKSTNVRMLPTSVIYKNGVEVTRLTGVQPLSVVLSNL